MLVDKTGKGVVSEAMDVANEVSLGELTTVSINENEKERRYIMLKKKILYSPIARAHDPGAVISSIRPVSQLY